ncbi:MAG: DUF6524 family protein [Betaproteobacteria bacterium]|jgi:hypothetical protein
MKTEQIDVAGIAIRLVLALLLVLVAYNPSGHSYVGWALRDFSAFSALKGFVGAVLLAAWVFAIRTPLASMGILGIGLLLLVLGTLVWLLIDVGALKDESPGVLTRIALLVAGTVLGVGLSWSAIRQRLTGQVEAD